MQVKRKASSCGQCSCHHLHFELPAVMGGSPLQPAVVFAVTAHGIITSNSTLSVLCLCFFSMLPIRAGQRASVTAVIIEGERAND